MPSYFSSLPRRARVVVLFLLIAIVAAAQNAPPRLVTEAKVRPESSLFQVSTLDALLSGIYGASMTLADLRQRGDFGLGTYEGLDGEMMLLDGQFYQMRFDGTLTEPPSDARTPFAAVTTFRPDVQFSVKQATLAQISDLIDSVLPSKNLFYAIRIHGTFAVMNTRAIPKQFLPYPPLAQLLPIQSLFTYSNIAGTAIDIRCPAYIAGVNQAGHHFHFVSDDHKSGGHALGFTTGEVTVEIQTLRQQTLWLPMDEPFLKATLPLQ
jgi:acetolactate decarboxylase